ncbi:MAG TPA: GDSL-type esterase/lipase family protein [Phycisphaerae bacterium]|jgi:lysophospholipase L1-like esterase
MPAPKVQAIDQPADQPATRLRDWTEQDADWLKRHHSFAARARQGNVDLLLIGDSLTDLWLSNYQSHYQQIFGRWKNANFAISGDRTEHLLWRLRNGTLEGITPKVVQLLIGTNNLPSIQGVYSAKEPEEVAAGISAILQTLRWAFPAARILLLAIPPREDRLNAMPPALPEDLNPKIRVLNGLVEKMADGAHIRFASFHDDYLDRAGKIMPGMLHDRLHPDMKGYEVWAAAVRPILTEWLG